MNITGDMFNIFEKNSKATINSQNSYNNSELIKQNGLKKRIFFNKF